MNVQTIKRLLSFCKPYRKYLYLILICSLGQIIFTLLTPIFIGQAVDTLIGVNRVDFYHLYIKIVYILLGVGLSSLLSWSVMRLSNHMTYSITLDLRNELFEKYETLPLEYIDQHAHGDLLSRMINDIDLIGDGLLQGFTNLFTGLCTILGTIVFMVYIHVTIAFIVIILTPLSLVVATLIARMTYKLIFFFFPSKDK